MHIFTNIKLLVFLFTKGDDDWAVACCICGLSILLAMSATMLGAKLANSADAHFEVCHLTGEHV